MADKTVKHIRFRYANYERYLIERIMLIQIRGVFYEEPICR